jgi:hypothetical protein
MTFGAREDERRSGASVDWRGVLWLLVSAAGLALCIGWLFLGMRAVMDIGGACADGGPYVPAQPCPTGVPLFMTLGMFGLFLFGGLGLYAGARVGGAWAALPLLAWPALFISLGWNFLEYGIAPPPELAPEGGPEWGWLIPGVVFWLMGGVPLALAWPARSSIRREGSAGVARRFGVPDFAGRAARRPPAPSLAWDPSERPGRATEAPEDVVDRLERLAALRRRGDLTTEEFDAFKRRLLGEEGRP